MNQSIDIDKDNIFELTLKLIDAPDTSVHTNRELKNINGDQKVEGKNDFLENNNLE